MRSVIVTTIISLDGQVAGPDGDVMVMPFDDGFSAYNLERLRTASTMLLGRRSYEGFLAHWPQVADDPDQPPVERDISRLNTTMDKLVVSDSLTVDPNAGFGATRVVPRADAVEAVRELKQGDGGDILVFGSATTWNPLLAAGVVDELHVMIGPAVIGGGTPLFSGDRPVPLELIESRVLPDSQLILARYSATRS